MEVTGSTLFSDRLFWRQNKFGGNWLHIILGRIVLEIWREWAPRNFLTDCFGGSSDLVGTGSTLFSDRLFWRQLKFWWKLAPHYFPTDCFGGSSHSERTGSTLFSGGLFWKFGHFFFRRIILEAAQIWKELAPHYFPTDCFGGSSHLEGTGSTLFSSVLFWNFGGNWLHIIFGRLFWRQLRFGGNWLHLIFRQIVLEAGQIWRGLAPHYFPADCFGNSEGTGSTLFSGGLF